MPTTKKKCVAANALINAYQTSSECAQISHTRNKNHPILSRSFAKFQSDRWMKTSTISEPYIKLFENTNLTPAVWFFFFRIRKKKRLVSWWSSSLWFFGSFCPSFFVYTKKEFWIEKSARRRREHAHF